jgi:hypothetical protein
MYFFACCSFSASFENAAPSSAARIFAASVLRSSVSEEIELSSDVYVLSSEAEPLFTALVDATRALMPKAPNGAFSCL